VLGHATDRDRPGQQARRNLRCRPILAAAASMMLLGAAHSASASAQAPAFRLDALTNTTAAPGSPMQYSWQIKNVGDADTLAPADPTCNPNTPPVDPGCIVLKATVPSGLTVAGISGGTFSNARCTGLGAPGPTAVTCASSAVLNAPQIAANQSFKVGAFTVNVDPLATGTLTTRFQVSGGGADPASTVRPVRVTSTLPDFGVTAFDAQVGADAAGDPFTQAAGHPYQVSTSVDFNTITNPSPVIGPLWPVAPAKDVLVDLPPGFVGNPTVADQCTTADLANSNGSDARPLCSPTSQVGTVTLRMKNLPAPLFGQGVWEPLPLFNLVPPANVPARFGFNVAGTIITLDAALRSGGDYGISVNSRNISEAIAIQGVSATFWGVPAAPSHDHERACPGAEGPRIGGPTCPSGAPLRAFLRTPTSCTPPGQGAAWGMQLDSWPNPGRENPDGTPDLTDPAWQSASFTSHNPPAYPSPPSEWGAAQGTTGCDHVPFTPSIDLRPSTSAPSSPSGLDVTLLVPQSDDPLAISQADLRKAVITLPEGMSINPATADGLGACTPAQIELHGTADPTCPLSSKIGTVSIQTPLLSDPVAGSVYVAAQDANPFHSTFAMYLVAKGPGVIIKLAGHIEVDPVTGRLTTTFDDQPQLPFSTLKLSLKTGPSAPLVTPATCGQKAFTSQLTGWNASTVTLTTPYTVDCAPGLGGFAPSFAAGSQSALAGAFSPFTVTVARSDLDQPLSGIRVTTPPGLLGMLSSVPLCGEPQAAQGTCSPASQIGHTTVSAGAGPLPITLPVAGQPPNPVYLTGPYHGAPFGLSVVVPALAGPFNLGTVVVRAAISVDRHTGRITIASDPLPQILQGVPLQVRSIAVTVDRPGFTFNPTSCEPLSVDGQVSSAQGATANLSRPFQASGCPSLAFHPSFTVSTSGKTSKANGASLDVKVSSGGGPHADPRAVAEANIAKVDVQLPVVLPARLPTLQKACTAAQFASDPAGCPEGSFVGTAVAHTPVLASPLSGPAILVSHGGEAFPDLVLVLQGEGVRIDLTGHTQIKKGITFNHFETVPDAPVSSFDLMLPAGPHGVLTTDVPGRNLCANTRTVRVTKRVTRRVNGHSRRVSVKAKKAVAAPLLMPTTITAQNGAVIHQNTKIAVTGCTAVKSKAKTKGKAGKATKARVLSSARRTQG
jgi:hypothetical protein